ncbi:Phospholipase D4 [Merluccius polli]|uniref:Phospholipase D4 n=1 Tax=Merluccius polli TaxID=89951 RepID=A0AA47M2C8_MERPO|nr:Phospholipase D4 [Merluccius polli]
MLYHFRIILVESIPLGVTYDEDNVTFGVPLEQAWNDLISVATEHIEVASFYWTLTGEDVNVNTTSDLPGEGILERLKALPSRNVSVQVVTSMPSLSPNSTDLSVLREHGVQVRRVDFGRLTKGVLHSKFWIVDKRHVFIGSPNMDWRALTEVKELGALIYNCTSLAEDLHKIFLSFWEMGHFNSSLPQPWPSEYDTSINRDHPLVVKDGNVSSRIYLSGSPPSFCPSSRTQDLEAIFSAISEAERFIDVSVMEYSPSARFHRQRRYWPVIDDVIKRAAFERQVHIRMLISCGRDSDPRMLPFLRSLASLNSPTYNINILVRLFIVPVGNKTDIPYARVNHNKYMVTDKVSYIGTSNWSEDYFSNTAGVGLVVSEHGQDPMQKTRTLHHKLQAIFNRDWHSQFSVDLDKLGQNPDCALSNP